MLVGQLQMMHHLMLLQTHTLVQMVGGKIMTMVDNVL